MAGFWPMIEEWVEHSHGKIRGDEALQTLVGLQRRAYLAGRVRVRVCWLTTEDTLSLAERLQALIPNAKLVTVKGVRLAGADQIVTVSRGFLPANRLREVTGRPSAGRFCRSFTIGTPELSGRRMRVRGWPR